MVIKAQIKKRMAAKPRCFTKVKAQIRGVVEETTTGVNRLYQLMPRGHLPFPRDQRNDSVTKKSKFGQQVRLQESLVDGIRPRGPTRFDGRQRSPFVCGDGDCVARGQRARPLRMVPAARVKVTEADPICGRFFFPGRGGGGRWTVFDVVLLEENLDADIFHHQTGNTADVIRIRAHARR